MIKIKVVLEGQKDLVGKEYSTNISAESAELALVLVANYLSGRVVSCNKDEDLQAFSACISKELNRLEAIGYGLGHIV